ncbi:hypothetical protein BDV26DRAFT_301603 [Aspergillus bertholletiae]|uniref:Ferric oxidoreductase domain-containing protein n=1 Tax=Aspergillus bertholletiae TaxID=1226010 RepID=A0A5N7AUW8_9EURO|nr:hypothetical protein BDV26DRAFT_301603 [Aspergillus bertholletiae]
MEDVFYYIVSVGGAISFCLILRLVPYLARLGESISWFYRRYLTNVNIISRHRLIGPFSWADLGFSIIYISLNIIFVFYPNGPNLVKGRRCGILALSNMVTLYASPGVSVLADLLGIRLRTWRRLHRAAGLMICALTGFHIIFNLTGTQPILLRERGIIYGIIASASILLAMLLPLPIIRQIVYPVFYPSHYLLAISVIYATWMHMPRDSSASWYLTYAILGTFGTTFLFEICATFYRNGAFGSRWSKGVIERRDDGSLRIEVVLGRPVVVLPGQYINLWVPSFNPWSWFQVSSFTITSWSVEKQHRLQFLAKRPNRSFGFTWLLTKSRQHLTFLSGPHGLSEPAPRYETVLLIASDAGILAIKPYVEQVFHCIKKKTSKTRRLCLAWHVSGQQMGMNLMTEMAGWINRLIYYNEEDKTHTMVFDPKRLIGLIPGESGTRGQISRSSPNFNDILGQEVQGHRQRLVEDVKAERGKMLVLVSASDKVRDDLQQSAKGYLRWVRIVELDYQPT